jgi:hypothetical protein
LDLAEAKTKTGKSKPKPGLVWFRSGLSLSCFGRRQRRQPNQNRNRRQIWLRLRFPRLCLCVSANKKDIAAEPKTQPRSDYGEMFLNCGGQDFCNGGRGCNASMWVHSSVVRAADCRSSGPWFKSGCAL